MLIDPYRPTSGEFPRSFSPQIALFSEGQENSVTLSQDPFILDTLGEVELKNVMLYSYPVTDKKNIFRVNIEGMNIVHLGSLNKKIETSLLEKIGSPDILFIPVGGGDKYLSPEDANSLVSQLEPRLVIPMGFKCDTDPKAGNIQDFVKEIGINAEKNEGKVIIKKKDLPQEDRKMIILEKDY